MYKVFIPTEYAKGSKTFVNFIKIMEDKLEFHSNCNNVDYVIVPPNVEHDHIRTVSHFKFMCIHNGPNDPLDVNQMINLLSMLLSNQRQDQELSLDLFFNINYVLDINFFQLYMIFINNRYPLCSQPKAEFLKGLWADLSRNKYNILSNQIANQTKDLSLYRKFLNHYLSKGIDKMAEVMSNKVVIDQFMHPYKDMLSFSGDIKINEAFIDKFKVK